MVIGAMKSHEDGAIPEQGGSDARDKVAKRKQRVDDDNVF